MEQKIKNLINKLSSLISNDLGIDLGTANTLVYLHGQGIVVNEPSVVAINQKTGSMVAVGNQAKEMLGRTPGHIVTIRPLVDGVISDFEVTEQMLAYLIRKAEIRNKKILGPRVVIGVPSGVTNVEVRSVRDAAYSAGARKVYIVEEPMAGAIGIGLSVNDPVGSMIVDIGGGTTDIAIISLGGIVKSRNIKIAGDRLNSDIINYIRTEFRVLIGEKTAEYLKITVGSASKTPDGDKQEEVLVRGRDLITGLPREIMVSEADIREAMQGSIAIFLDSIKEILESVPPEILGDIMKRGVNLVGGGALIRGLDIAMKNFLKLDVKVAPDPLTAIVRGAGMILENFQQYKEALIKEDD